MGDFFLFLRRWRRERRAVGREEGGQGSGGREAEAIRSGSLQAIGSF
jgi:hypothetical protein